MKVVMSISHRPSRVDGDATGKIHDIDETRDPSEL